MWARVVLDHYAVSDSEIIEGAQFEGRFAPCAPALHVLSHLLSHDEVSADEELCMLDCFITPLVNSLASTRQSGHCSDSPKPSSKHVHRMLRSHSLEAR
eukprot:m.163711 g.163711  ORF g.163711 m.163711 type:complete len:99 (+) comp53089_c0_seq28:747-1043(+)